ESNPNLSRHVVTQEIDRLDMEVSGVYPMCDTHLHLLAHHVCEGAVDGLAHWPIYASGDLQFSSAWCATNLQPIKPDLALIMHRARVNAAGCERVGRDHIATSLFWDADESLLPCLAVDQGERGLVVLEAPNLLHLFLDAATTFEAQLGQLGQFLFR